jgi:serine/threonine protein kinase
MDISKSDIFSLGLTIYELMIMEQLPHNGPEWESLRDGKLPKLYNTSYSQQLKDLVASMVQKDWQKRPSAR